MAKAPPAPCRVCGQPKAPRTRKPLCQVHTKQFCCRCDEPLPEGWKQRRCSDCEAAKKARVYAKPGRICCLCGKREATGKSSWCNRCRRETYRIERKCKQRARRPCEACGVLMPYGRRCNRCTACERTRQRQRLREKHQREELRCRMCGEHLPGWREFYCIHCQGMLNRWRRDWNRGNAVARRLGTVRPWTYWEKKE